MPRKKQNTVFVPKQVFLMLVILLGLGALANIIKSTSSSQLTAIILLAFGALGILLSYPIYQRSVLLKKIKSQVDIHLPALQSQRDQKLQKDPYGSLPDEKWRKEIKYFLTSQVMPVASSHQRRLLQKEPDRWVSSVANYVEQCEAHQPALVNFDSNMSGAEFEVFCAKAIEQAGWRARVTSAGRDQGADIIADKNGERLVIQCKKYSSPVGNKAVQEVVAARNHQNAKYAAVVTNNAYTSAAKQLASTNGVKLLHFSDLKSIDDRLLD